MLLVSIKRVNLAGVPILTAEEAENPELSWYLADHDGPAEDFIGEFWRRQVANQMQYSLIVTFTNAGAPKVYASIYANRDESA